MNEKEELSSVAAEEGISSVNEIRKPGINAKAFFGLALACVLMVGLVTIFVARYQAQRKMDASAKQSDSLVTTASSAGAQPLKIIGNVAGVPPTVGGVQPGVAVQDARAPQTSPAASPTVPAIDPDAIDAAPIAVRATAPNPTRALSSAAGIRATAGAPQALDPFDAPILLTPAPALSAGGRALAGSGGTGGAPSEASLDAAMAQTRARLDETRARLEQQLVNLPGAKTQGLGEATGSATPKPPNGDSGLKMSSTARVGAARLVAPALTLPRGMTFTCALASKIVSEQTGPVSCVVARNVFGTDGRVLLIERGSHLDGAYRAQVKVGQTRVAVIWDRLRMPNGVVVDLASPATGPLGEAGVDGFVDNHWPQRIGAALLLSLLDDAVKIEIASQQAKGNGSGTVVLQGTGSETSTLAGKVLDSTINIPPTVVKNQGEIVAVNVAQDIDFSTVYELRASKLQ